MSFLRAFGHAVPERVVTNEELADLLGADPEWMFAQSGIRERRYAGPADSVVSLGVLAAQNCLNNAGIDPADVKMLLVASGSPDRYCPGPAGEIAARLGLAVVPALDLPIGSAGSLAALVLAARLAPSMGTILVVASEIMSRRIDLTPEGKATAMLFGDGAGAALVSPDSGFAQIVDTCLHTDGSSAEALAIDAGRIHMDGGVVIRHATRRMPEAMTELLARRGMDAAEIGVFLLHQANLNLLTRVAKSVGAPIERFFTNIERYGNSSSASMLIAASDWRAANSGPISAAIMFSAFGMGFNWGALLALPSQ